MSVSDIGNDENPAPLPKSAESGSGVPAASATRTSAAVPAGVVIVAERIPQPLRWLGVIWVECAVPKSP